MEKLTFEVDGVDVDIELSQANRDVISMLEKMVEIERICDKIVEDGISVNEYKPLHHSLNELEYDSFVRQVDGVESSERSKAAYIRACRFIKEHGSWKKDLVKAYKNSINNGGT